jgi:filamentous hemagglutinin
MKAGNAPQLFNFKTGKMESSELSHEPVPQRDGGTEFVPRWREDH